MSDLFVPTTYEGKDGRWHSEYREATEDEVVDWLLYTAEGNSILERLVDESDIVKQILEDVSNSSVA